MLSARARAWRATELLALFVAGPGLIAWASWAGHIRPGPIIFPAIWALGLYAFVVLWRDPTFDRRRFWNRAGVAAAWRAGRGRFVVLGLAATLLLLAIDHRDFLRFPRSAPVMWMIVMVGYPVLSVYPQELAFRAFFFHRYAPLLPGRGAMLACSSVIFAWAHVVLLNWVALGFSLVGGVLFGLTYRASRSTLAASLEHAAYGCFVFTVGWGLYFYGGAVRPGE